jgi:hypothetical protein
MYDWIIDSSATQHMTFQQEWFTTYERISPRRVFMGDDTVMEAILEIFFLRIIFDSNLENTCSHNLL